MFASSQSLFSCFSSTDDIIVEDVAASSVTLVQSGKCLWRVVQEMMSESATSVTTTFTQSKHQQTSHFK